jgi:exodeoxyribonuclease VII large subunit
LLHVDVLPVPVQGEGAPAQIVTMLQRAYRSGRYDTILLARGGGSLEDLWAFNDERLVRAIAQSPVPVVSAIGHETDFSLSDFVADVRAPTPSVAAELLVPSAQDLRARLRQLQRRVATLQLHHLRRDQQRADRAAIRLHAMRPQARLAMLHRRQEEAHRRLHAALHKHLDRLRARMRHSDAVLRAMQPRRRLATLRQQLESLRLRPRAAIARRLTHDALRLRGVARSLEAVSPLKTVARGYAILLNEEGHVIRSVQDARVGDRLEARLTDGRLPLRVIAPDDKG